MSDFMGDISNYLSVGKTGTPVVTKSKNDNMGLEMTDFLNLMVTQLTSQSMDQTADTSEMLNQMVQMQMITAITNLTDASIMSYAASLVGKEVTVGQYDAEGNLKQTIGQVTGTGTYGGEQVVFVGDKYYYMSEIMAVGRLPEVQQPEEGAGSEPEPNL
jgi:flagellar basal-body rod modification protein FlgD